MNQRVKKIVLVMLGLIILSLFTLKDYMDKRAIAERNKPEVVDQLVSRCATLMEQDGNWKWDETGRALPIYNTLKETDNKAVLESLVRHLFKPELRLRVLYLSVKLGIEGSQEKLVNILFEHGDKSMAEDFLNSGSPALSDGGRAWANSHGFSISQGQGSHRAAWGQF